MHNIATNRMDFISHKKNVNFIELYFIFTFLQSYLDVFYAIRTIIP